MSLLQDVRSQRPTTPEEAAKITARALESMVLKQMIASSGMLKSAQGASGGWTADLFADTLADAVSAAGGMGLAPMLQNSLPGGKSAGAGKGTEDATLSSVGIASAALTTARRDPPPSAVPGTSAPLAHAAMTSDFGPRTDPITGAPRIHRGVDLGAAEGTEIRSVMEGEVVQAGPRGAFGNTVEVNHGNGVHTLYAHASRVEVVAGQKVSAGEVLAEVGQTGRATGPHLHFELHRRGRPVNPAQVLKFYGARADSASGGQTPPGGTP